MTYLSYIFLEMSNKGPITQQTNIEYCKKYDSSLIQLENQMKVDLILDNLKKNALDSFFANCTRIYTDACSNWKCCQKLQPFYDPIIIG